MSYSATHYTPNPLAPQNFDYTALDSRTLHQETLRAASNEKTATLVLLDYLAEVDRRRLYAEWSYTSLFEYVHKALGYSEAQSSERVSAMRLLRKVPEVKAALEKGALTLTSTAKLASHVRREKSSIGDTLRLLEQCEGKATREVERVLVENSTRIAPLPERIKAVSPAITRITFEVDDKFMALVSRMRELDGNPGLTLQETFRKAMKEYVKRREIKTQIKKPQIDRSELKLRPKSAGVSRNLSNTNLRGASRAPEVKQPSRYIPTSVRHTIRLRSQDQCEYRSPENKRRCESRSGLQYDHIFPFGKGGTSSHENIRHLCRSHNLFYAVQSYGREKMRPYLQSE